MGPVWPVHAARSFSFAIQCEASGLPGAFLRPIGSSLSLHGESDLCGFLLRRFPYIQMLPLHFKELLRTENLLHLLG